MVLALSEPFTMGNGEELMWLSSGSRKAVLRDDHLSKKGWSAPELVCQVCYSLISHFLAYTPSVTKCKMFFMLYAKAKNVLHFDTEAVNNWMYYCYYLHAMRASSKVV